jgi:hypothetical protein
LCLLVPVQGVPSTTWRGLALRAPFNIAAEGGWDVGCTAGCLVAAACIAGGASLAQVIPLAFVGMLGNVFLLRRCYVRAGGW